MNHLIFHDRNVTVLNRESELLFDPKEIGEILELTENWISKKITEMEDETEKVHLSRTQIESLSEGSGLNTTLNNFGKTYLTEAGMYQFVIESRSAVAKEFKRWICSEVIPSIRKHGIYATQKTTEELLQNPDLLIDALLKLKAERAAKEKAEKERLWIRSKAEATAMATASAKSREVEKLKGELGECRKYASILRVALETKTSEKQYSWKKLKDYSIKNNLKIKKIADPRFGSANVYSRDAWYEVYGIDLEELFQ